MKLLKNLSMITLLVSMSISFSANAISGDVAKDFDPEVLTSQHTTKLEKNERNPDSIKHNEKFEGHTEAVKRNTETEQVFSNK